MAVVVKNESGTFIAEDFARNNIDRRGVGRRRRESIGDDRGGVGRVKDGKRMAVRKV